MPPVQLEPGAGDAALYKLMRNYLPSEDRTFGGNTLATRGCDNQFTDPPYVGGLAMADTNLREVDQTEPIPHDEFKNLLEQTGNALWNAAYEGTTGGGVQRQQASQGPEVSRPESQPSKPPAVLAQGEAIKLKPGTEILALKIIKDLGRDLSPQQQVDLQKELGIIPDGVPRRRTSEHRPSITPWSPKR